MMAENGEYMAEIIMTKDTSNSREESQDDEGEFDDEGYEIFLTFRVYVMIINIS